MNRHEEIIRSVIAGDAKAFARLYGLLSPMVYNTAISYVQNQHNAEEITQEVFIKIYKSLSSFKGGSSLNTWTYRITINTSLNYIKKNKKRAIFQTSDSQPDTPDFDHPGIILEKKEESRSLFNAIYALPENQKTAFILSFIENIPRQEVADVMGVSLKAVESLLQRAKKNLRISLIILKPNEGITKLSCQTTKV